MLETNGETKSQINAAREEQKRYDINIARMMIPVIVTLLLSLVGGVYWLGAQGNAISDLKDRQGDIRAIMTDNIQLTRSEIAALFAKLDAVNNTLQNLVGALGKRSDANHGG